MGIFNGPVQNFPQWIFILLKGKNNFVLSSSKYTVIPKIGSTF
jgi:hypothetical protein